jgi:tetratricopeptide (TPR) repeat protein
MRLALWLAAFLAAGSAGGPPSPLVSYSFDEDVDTGPDTFSVFQHAQGTVRLATSPRLSGFRSLEIRDVPGDGSFPELQGYFELRRRGRLYAHFAFLTTDPRQDFNIALAGPAHFTLRRDGIAFWLAARGGSLVHHPATRATGPARLAGVGECASVPLLKLTPFLWYVVDVAYDIDAGRYDLTVRQEGREEPVVRLARQPNASSRAGSAVDKFSFIGDLQDAFSATYYVDDVVIGTDERIVQLPFVAPGRRRLFVDRFEDAARQAREKSCLPVVEPADFGLTSRDLQAVTAAGLLDVLRAAAAGRTSDPGRLAPLEGDARRRLAAAQQWAAGCAALGADPAQALALFDRAAGSAPEARIVPPSAVLAAARLKRWDEAERRLAAIPSDWRDDPRYGVVLAIVGAARGRLEEAEAWLRSPAEGIAEGGAMGRAEPLVATEYYFVLLAKEDYGLAQDYAQRMARRLGGRPAAAVWLERAGDVAVRLRRLGEARELYEGSRVLAPTALGPWLKLADVAFLDGDLATERSMREAIYGRLGGPGGDEERN